MDSSKNETPALCCDSYVAVAMQPKIYGCRNRADIKMNLKNQLQLLDHAFPQGFLIGSPVKLVAFPEGSIQGFYDETSHMDHGQSCRDLAIRIPGEETEILAQKAKEYGVYIAAQAKVLEPDIASDRFYNQAFIISPQGEIILKHTKNIISLVEGSASPYDLWEKWSARYGESLEAYYPVVKTDIGNLAVSICAETMFPETYRAFTVMGAEVVIRMTLPEPMVMWGIWESTNRAHAFHNACYLVCPNGGAYYLHPEDDSSFNLLGGNSMIVDFRGNIVNKVIHNEVTGVPGEIHIKTMREYRATSPQSAHISQMRSDLWKQIYERWPDYPKNLYKERTYNHALERFGLNLQSLEKLLEAGIFTRPIK